MVRAESPVYQELWPEIEVAVADALDFNSLKTALDGIDTAYYLIHSLLLGPHEFAEADKQAAENFRRAAEEMQIKRIIYLGGLGDSSIRLSNHLWSRIEVAEELKGGEVSTTVLRAAIIIGSGSASYEIIQHLVKRLVVCFLPRWARKNKCQPIAVRDVIKYLVGCLEVRETSGKSFDIGGKDVLTYKQMMIILGSLLHLKRVFIPSPFSNVRFFAYLTSLFTPVPNQITSCLIEGLKNDVVCHNDLIKKFFPFEPLSYKESIVRAMSREEQDRVYTRWSDSYPPAHELAMKLEELKDVPMYTGSYSLITAKEAASLFNSICQIGGREGWFHSNWMWRLRGTVDRILLGVGTSRGRRSRAGLKINDVIDFWRVEDLQQDKRLLLRAEMKVPGKAWLEFAIADEEGKRTLSVVPYYNTKTFWGKIYWYIFLPFHHFIFNDLIRQIEKMS